MNVIDFGITDIINEDFSNEKSSEKEKIANVCPIYKKEPRQDLKNVQTVSVLIALSKIYEKLTHKSIAINFKPL